MQNQRSVRLRTSGLPYRDLIINGSLDPAS